MNYSVPQLMTMPVAALNSTPGLLWSSRLFVFVFCSVLVLFVFPVKWERRMYKMLNLWLQKSKKQPPPPQLQGYRIQLGDLQLFLLSGRQYIHVLSSFDSAVTGLEFLPPPEGLNLQGKGSGGRALNVKDQTPGSVHRGAAIPLRELLGDPV